MFTMKDEDCILKSYIFASTGQKKAIKRAFHNYYNYKDHDKPYI